MDETKQKMDKIHRRMIVIAVVLIVFCIVDDNNSRYDRVLRDKLKQKFDNIDTLQDFDKDVDASTVSEIENAETIKKITGILALLLGLFFLYLWSNLSLSHKFLFLSFASIYLAGMKIIDYEYLFHMHLNSESLTIARHLIVRIFPAFFFLILFATTKLYKLIPQDTD